MAGSSTECFVVDLLSYRSIFLKITRIKKHLGDKVLALGTDLLKLVAVVLGGKRRHLMIAMMMMVMVMVMVMMMMMMMKNKNKKILIVQVRQRKNSMRFLKLTVVKSLK